MKADIFYHIEPGAKLILKPERQKAYGFQTDTLTFLRVAERIGYATPNIWACKEGNETPFCFKPSDFRTVFGQKH